MFHPFSIHTKLFSFLFALIGLMLLLSIGQVFARSAAQADPDVVWEEGLALTTGNTPNNIAIPAVATAPGTYYRTFSGTRFQATNSSLTYSANGGAIYATALPAGGYSFSLDFDLPAGAAITEVVFFVIDNHATDMGLSLRSYNPETDQFVLLESAASSGASGSLQTIVVPVDPTVQVDNATTSYRLRVAPGVATSAHLLRGARIGYTIPTSFLPIITSE